MNYETVDTGNFLRYNGPEVITMQSDLQEFGLFQILQQFRRINWGANLKELTQPEYMALSAIAHLQQSQPDSPGIYVSSLAEELVVSVSMVSKMLKVLEEKGWILRTVDPDRRRNTFVSLTEAGRRLYTEESERAAATNRRVVARMGEETMTRFLKDAEKLAKCIAQELGSS